MLEILFKITFINIIICSCSLSVEQLSAETVLYYFHANIIRSIYNTNNRCKYAKTLSYYVGMIYQEVAVWHDNLATMHDFTQSVLLVKLVFGNW